MVVLVTEMAREINLCKLEILFLEFQMTMTIQKVFLSTKNTEELHLNTLMIKQEHSCHLGKLSNNMKDKKTPDLKLRPKFLLLKLEIG